MSNVSNTLSPLLRMGPPRAPEAEQALLGALLLDAETISRIEGKIRDQDFFDEIHRRIFRTIIRLYADGRSIDIVTLHNALKGDNLYQESGGESYLASLLERVGSAAHLEEYARIVREKAVLRELIRAATEIYEECSREENRKDGPRSSSDISQVLDHAESKIFKVAQERSTTGFVCIRDMVHPLMESLEKARQQKAYVTGINTGFKKLDEFTSGFQKTDFIIIAGRPGQGKTAFALNLASNVALGLGKAVAVFSLEMDSKSLLLRMLCGEARANAQMLRRGYLERERFEAITHAASRFLEADIYLDDTRSLTPLDIRSRSRRLATELRLKGKELGLVVIDYLQLLRSSERTESRQTEVAEISRSLKALAKDLDVPLVALSQLSRRPEEKGREGRPQLADLRESGALEQDADLVLFLYREETYKPNDPRLAGKAELIIGKQRNGPLGTVDLTFIKEYTRFEEAAYSNEAAATDGLDAIVE